MYSKSRRDRWGFIPSRNPTREISNKVTIQPKSLQYLSHTTTHHRDAAFISKNKKAPTCESLVCIDLSVLTEFHPESIKKPRFYSKQNSRRLRARGNGHVTKASTSESGIWTACFRVLNPGVCSSGKKLGGEPLTRMRRGHLYYQSTPRLHEGTV